MIPTIPFTLYYAPFMLGTSLRLLKVQALYSHQKKKVILHQYTQY